MEITLYIFLGMVVGVAIGILYCKSKQGVTETKLAAAQVTTDELKKENQSLQQKAEKVNAELLTEKGRNNGLEQKMELIQSQAARTLAEKDREKNEALQAQENHYKQTLSELQKRFDEMSAKMAEQMKTATAEMLKQRQKEFAERSNNDIGQIVNPLRETIEKMKKSMDDNTLKQTAMSSEMRANIENMMRHSEAAKQSAEELTRVFKHGNKVQGDWGETVLSELLASQGLVEGRHFETQVTMRDEKGNVIKTQEGAMLRPDVILHLDAQRDLIIDSKVSLKAFIDYVNAENDEDRQRYLKEHIESLKKHVKELSVKDYSSYIASPKVKMDYVIMFVPHSGALWTALNEQQDLWRNAMEQNVFIADEQTLYAALRIINLTWTQITQAQNHEQVYKLANEMIERVGLFLNKYEEIGKCLAKATDAYNDAHKKLETNGPSIIYTSNKLIKLGAKIKSSNKLSNYLGTEMLELKEDNETEIEN